MTKRRKIAVAYALAISILFVVLFLEVGAVYRLNAHEHEIRNRAATLNTCDDLIFALQDAQTAAQSYVATGARNYRTAYTDAAARVSGSLRALNELARNDAALQSEMQGLNSLATKHLVALQRAGDSKKGSGMGAVDSPDGTEFGVIEETDEALAKIRADEQARSQMELARAAQSASSVNTLIKYGGVVMIWVAGVAALLLFYDDAGRFREGVERRLHTDILESLPLGLCLTTASGSVLYANRSRAKIAAEMSHAGLPEAAIFVVSSDSQPDLIIQAMRSGCSEYRTATEPGDVLRIEIVPAENTRR